MSTRCTCRSYLASESAHHEGILPVKGTPEGWVFLNQEPLLMSQVESKGAGRPTYQLAAGLKSGCWVPLDCAGEVLGTCS